jgi:hypothetical protein
MGPLDLTVHILNFLAPALVVALLLAAARPVFAARGPHTPGWFLLALLNFTVGAATLAGGLWWFGTDGKMATYAALVLACASSQWVALRWNR